MANHEAPATLSLEIDYLEAVQIEAALQARLAAAGKAEALFDGASIESDMVAHEIRYTGAALAKLQLLLYGTDEPDEPAWLHDIVTGLPTILIGWTEPELREAFGV